MRGLLLLRVCRPAQGPHDSQETTHKRLLDMAEDGWDDFEACGYVPTS